VVVPAARPSARLMMLLLAPETLELVPTMPRVEAQGAHWC